MKKYTLIALVACVAYIAVAATPSHAQAMIKADVPFDFCAGHGSLPAGSYTIARTGGQSALMLSSGQRDVEFMLPNSTDWRDDIQTPKLVFHRYGNQYFLAEIWSSSDGSVRKLAVNRREKQLAKNGVTQQVALVYGVVPTANGN